MNNNQSTASLQKAVIYARVSSKEQEKEGFSIPAQLKLLNKYAADNRLQVVQEYVDVETAKKSGRTGFTEMIKLLRKEAKAQHNVPCRTLLVEKTDRLYRNLKDWVTLDELDLEIHFVKENVILSQESRSSEKFMHGIKVLMAKNYIDNLSEETKKGMLEKAEQGIYPSFAPLGYINVECNGKRFIQPDPVAGPQVRQLFEWYATGNYSLLDLTRKAYDEGFAFRKSNQKVPKSIVHKILKNPIYYGEFRWARKIYRGVHEPLISRELFERVQEVMGEKGRRNTKQQKHSWAFQGLLSCGHCGCAMVAEIKKNQYVYYHCTRNKGECPEKWVREEEIARQFGQAIAAIKMDEDILGWVTAALKESHTETKKYHTESMAKLQAQYEKLQGRLDAMYEDKLDGRIGQDFYDRKSTAWKKEQDEILRKLERYQNANRSYMDEGVKILELAQRAVILYEKQNDQEKRRIINFVCSNSIWKDGSLIPNYRQPFNILVEKKRECQKEKAAFPVKNGHFENWLPGRDSNPRQGG
ncbi:MAG: recombinase family protein [Deltaproteobacteria bacterium]|nr:recombinase family protein [Deltaproteobacteria bacterium]